MNSSFESETKSQDRQEKENKHKQDEMLVLAARIIRIFIKHYFIKCFHTYAITHTITRQSNSHNSWIKRFHDLYTALKQHRPLERPFEYEETQIELCRCLHVSYLDKLVFVLKQSSRDPKIQPDFLL